MQIAAARTRRLGLQDARRMDVGDTALKAARRAHIEALQAGGTQGPPAAG